MLVGEHASNSRNESDGLARFRFGRLNIARSYRFSALHCNKPGIIVLKILGWVWRGSPGKGIEKNCKHNVIVCGLSICLVCFLLLWHILKITHQRSSLKMASTHFIPLSESCYICFMKFLTELTCKFLFISVRSYRYDVTLSLNNRDPAEEDDENMTSLGIVSGDLVYVLSDCEQPDCTTAVQKSNLSTAAASSGLESVVHSDVDKMETEACTVDKHRIEAVVNTSDTDRRTDCSGTMPQCSSSASENVDSFADDGHQVVAETGNTGTPYTMSAEELQLVNRYLNEPMVIREATDQALPQTLILADSVICPQTPDAALLTVIDVLMSELGYRHTMVRESTNG